MLAQGRVGRHARDSCSAPWCSIVRGGPVGPADRHVMFGGAIVERALVLGATGFIGGAIARALVGSGYTVRAFRRSTGHSLALEGLDVEEAYGDLRDRETVRRALDGCDLLFHAAGFYPHRGESVVQALRLGVESVRPVLDAAADSGLRRI